jgi:hypothetical protein
MTSRGLDAYREVWLVDFEFSQPPGEWPRPICLVAKELRSGRTIRLWQDQLEARRTPPFPIGPDSLIVAYLASAELSCFLALGWDLPACVLDLYVEFRNLTNGLYLPHGNDVLGALLYFDLPALDAGVKKAMRDLAIRGGPWTEAERRALLEYCESDVVALERLLPAMLPRLDFPRAVACRGRYMKAVARIERPGVPLDVAILGLLREHWDSIQDRLIGEVDSSFGVFDGRTFKAGRWGRWLTRHRLAWPLLESGRLALDDDTFRERARTHPEVALMRELRVSLSRLRLHKLAVGSDGRNRVMLSPFRAKTSRNQPSNSRFIFGPSTWLRCLIRPGPGRALAYVDWSQQEFGIAAALSGDPAMLDAYTSGDPYLRFGQQCGHIPPHGTKETHEEERELAKACILGQQYGMGAESLAQRINRPTFYARELLSLHRQIYPRYWAWSDNVQDHAMFWSSLPTVFGWYLHIGPDANTRSLRNYPCQANGAELLRLLCSLLTEMGIDIVATIHDAILIEAAIDDIDQVVAKAQMAMAMASEIILDGFRLRSEAKIIRWPDRYVDKRGREFWNRVIRLLPVNGLDYAIAPDPAEIQRVLGA